MLELLADLYSSQYEILYDMEKKIKISTAEGANKQKKKKKYIILKLYFFQNDLQLKNFKNA